MRGYGCSGCSGILAFIILTWLFFKFLFVPLLGLVIIIWIIKSAFGFWSNRKNNSDEYINLIFAVAGYVAAHSSSDRDLQYITIDNVIEKLHLSDENIEKARRYTEQGRSFSENQIQNLILENRSLWSNKETCISILFNQICVMFSDEILTRSEISLFASLTKWYNFSPEEGKAILKNWLEALGYAYDKKNDWYSTTSSYQEYNDSYQNDNNYQQSYSYTSESELEKAYKVLGINASTTDTDAKKAYKQKMIRYHPDRAASQGLGEDGIKRYTELSQQIQEAWNIVKKYRHIK